ncbi:MAG: hypothetical protein JEY91_18020 [Spirochaetaceae bacterium]|nr:hypothetical protein [Spirochaetaceae bacterium]
MTVKQITISVLTILLIFSMTSLSAQDNQDDNFYSDLLNLADSEVLTSPTAGDYVIYENSFAAKKLIISILYIGDQSFYIKTFNKDNYEMNDFNLRIADNNGLYGIDKISMKTGELSNVDILLAQSDFLDLLNSRKDVEVQSFPENIQLRKKWSSLDTTFEYEFAYWIPLTGLLSRIDINNKTNSLKLVRFGTLKGENDTIIRDFTGLDTGYDNSPASVIPDSDDAPAIFDGIKIPLDGNWNINNEINTATLNIGGERFSHFTIQTIPGKNLPENPYQFLSWQLINSNAYIIPDSVHIFDFKGTPTLQFTVLDEKTLKMTISMTMLFDRGEFSSVLQFGSYLNFYTENKEYFDQILF